MKNIKVLLKSGDEKTLDTLYQDPLVIWIDWREYDEDIVKYCENVLKTGVLTVEERVADNDNGFEVVILYKEKETVIPYKAEADRDTTIITLNNVIQPKYEIRFCEWSLGSDTLAIIPILSSSWELLEKEFGEEKVRKYFSVIDKNKKMFNL